MNYRCYQITLQWNIFAKIWSGAKRLSDIYHFGAGLEVTGRTRGTGQNVLQSSFQTWSSSSPCYCHIFFPIRFVHDDLIRRVIIILCINCIIIICIINNAIIINNYWRLRNLILLFKLLMGKRKDLFEIYRQFGHAPSNWFPSSPLYWQRHPGLCVYFRTVSTKSFNNMVHPLIFKCYCSWIKISLNVWLVDEDLFKGAGLSPDPIFMV
jgi:hypothetical protein